MSDAVRAHYAQALQRRMQAAPEAVQRVLQERLQRALAETAEAPEVGETSPPRARQKKTLSPLGQLNQTLASAQAGPDLKSAQRFRETWSRICAEEEVTQAVERGPENAGPLNSHMLVLRTLGLMRDLSPDYLRRFMSHADTLLWLDQAHGRLKEPAGKTKPVKTGRVKR
ncbi:DUF2894 domain-containing protein [Hydrogenophaga sp. PBL-H3]|uniref:DUF2894 domain-containing protein n=1 Tax=Hydrogenophaga sp. PBL-H3 TaxID=434010 RepID=UPI00131F7CF1|nr:DUF2894 domain-containing protein [Hydrogenophaga sp. PBL-H3]QHE77404.1 DUF2894 domain-containing protein [Hydrogenophaga sp. PBL-H3]QHE81828.1 DUF2894 domain-containing protein [Hydrogenophaga sp. PBL-H3]